MNKILIIKSAGQRIDKFLAEKYPKLSRRFMQENIKSGKILLNKKTVTPSYRLKKRDQIILDPKYLQDCINTFSHKSEVKINKKIVFKTILEHPDFLIIEKPAGLSVHPTEFFSPETKRLNASTLVNGLIYKYPELIGIGEDYLRPGIVHRLDKDTSGIMLIVKKEKAFNYFKTLFKERKIEKKYLAMVWGSFSSPLLTNPSLPTLEKKSKTLENVSQEWKKIDTLIGKSKSDLRRQSTSKFPHKLINPKKSKTFYRIISNGKDILPKFIPNHNQPQTVSLLEVWPKTGRKHQVRIHLHSIGHSLVGDRKYQTKLVKPLNKNFSRHLLHAHYLSFKYLDGKKYTFKSKMPKEFHLT